jgi:hypothetical protein
MAFIIHKYIFFLRRNEKNFICKRKNFKCFIFVKNGDFAPEQEEKGQVSWNARIARNFKANRWNF